MKIKIFTMLLAVYLSGCTTFTNEELSWIKYYDKKDAPLKEMRFMKLARFNETEIQPFEKVGSFYIKGNKENNSFGYSDSITLFRYSKTDATFGLVNLDSHKPVEVITGDSLEELGKATKIRFYDIGRGMIEVADYQSSKGICKGFTQSGVNVDFVTNYYVDMKQSQEEFITTFNTADLILKTGAHNIQTTVVDSIKSTKFDKVKDEFQKNVDTMVKNDAQKLGRFLLTICHSEL